MALPAGFLDELKTRLPLSAFVGRSVKLSRAGREWKGCCPFHNEKTASFYVNDEKAFYHCFGCGVHGDVITFAMQTQGWEFPEAIETLAREAGMQVPERTSRETPEQQDARTRLYQLLDAATAYFAAQLYAPVGRTALAYLQQRGLTDETIATWRLGYAPADAQALRAHLIPKGYTEQELIAVGLWRTREDKSGGYSFFRHRVMFPVTDRRGRPVAFSARLLDTSDKDAPKYINSSENILFKKGELLFGAEHARVRSDNKARPLLLVEGNMDVISLVQAGIPAVAPLGTALTELQLAALFQLARGRDQATPVLCFDGDKAGLRAAARALGLALPQLSPEKTLNFCFLPQGEDPDSLVKTHGADALWQLVAAAKPLVDVLWELETADGLHTTPEARSALEKSLAARTSQIADAPLRSHYERDFKDRLWKLFNQRRFNASAVTPFKAGNNRNNAQSVGALAPRTPLSGQSQALLQEKIALALLVNYPALHDEAAAWLLEHQALDAKFAPVLAALSRLPEHFSDRASLDAAGCARYLEDECGGAILSVLQSEALYQQYSYTRPEGDLADARRAWREMVSRKDERHLLDSEIKAAQEAFKADSTEATLERLNALMEARAALHEQLNDVLNEAHR